MTPYLARAHENKRRNACIFRVSQLKEETNESCCYEIFCLRVCKLQDMLRLTVLQANTLGQQSVPSFFAAFFSCCLQVMKGPPRSPWTKMTSAAILELREERELNLPHLYILLV